MFTLIAFSAGLAFLLGTARLLRFKNQNDKSDLITAAMFLASALILLHLFLELSGRIHRFAHLGLLNVPAAFLTGPLMYFYFYRLMYGRMEVAPPAWPHFIPAAVSICILIPFYIRSTEEKIRYFAQNQDGTDPYAMIGLVLIGMAVLANVCYLVYLLWTIYRLRQHSTGPEAFHPFLILLGTLTLVILTFAVGQFLFVPLLSVASVGLGLLFAILFLWYEPGTSRNFGVQSRRAHYSVSRLQGINVDGVLARLDDVMREERAFLDEDLSLARLADDLKIKPQQLSEILNVRMQKTFREFVNGFRLEEAAALLSEDSNRSILSITYAAGFNSRSSFHKLFQSRFGCSPIEFRKRHTSGKNALY